MSGDVIHVFVSIAPSHNKNFEKIIALEKLYGKTVLVNAGHYSYNPDVWSMVISGPSIPMGNPSEGSILTKLKFQLTKIRSYRKTIVQIKKLLPKNQWILYYCNLEDILNNYLFFKFRGSMLKERILVEDGILNYYDYKISKDRARTFYMKKLLSGVFGIPYKIVEGQLSGIDLPEVNRQYVKFPEMAIYPEKAVPIGNDKISYEPREDCILFIGQDVLENSLGPAIYKSKLNQIIGHIGKTINQKSIVYYKPHRNGDHSNALKQLKESFGNKVELVLDNSPVEDLIEDIRPVKIYSFYSTALVNIKMALKGKNNVSVYSLPFASVDQNVRQLFKHVGVKILE